MAHILVIDDEAAIRRFLRISLVAEGHQVSEAVSVGEGLAQYRHLNPDLVILDLGLPDGDGLQVLQAIREHHANPVLVLSARDSEQEKVRLLDAGANDYMSKPFDVSEFEARVRMLLRRQAGLRSSALSFGGVDLDLNSRTFSAGGTPLDIPARELGLLEILFMRAGKVVSKEAIMQSLAAFDEDLSANAIEQYVSRLRRRIAPHGLTVRTARGIGYYLDKVTPA